MCVSVQMQWLRNECTEVQVLKKVYLSTSTKVLEPKPARIPLSKILDPPLEVWGLQLLLICQKARLTCTVGL